MTRAIWPMTVMVLLAVNEPARACASIRTSVELTVGYTSWSSTGSVACEDSMGSPFRGDMKVSHSVYDVTDSELGSTTYGSGMQPYTGTLWSNSASGTTPRGRCYRAYATGEAKTITWGDVYQHSGSPQRCSPPAVSGPREQHGYDLCPLVVDLDGDGIATSGKESPVWFFDSNRDGITEPSGWTAASVRDAFLWLDLDGDERPDPGELFGKGMPLPTGVYANNGFHALGVFDQVSFGGNEDGSITRDDTVWERLRLWIDVNHDAQSQPRELLTPGSEQILAFDLTARRTHWWDSAGNIVMFEGFYRRRVADTHSRFHETSRSLNDISFINLAE